MINTTTKNSRCCSCGSSWIQKAKSFVTNNNNVRPDQDEELYYQAQVVNYLLNNDHCGIECRISIDKIMDGVNFNGSREDFQHKVLIPLKKKGIVATLVYSGNKGGVFIPCDEDEIKIVIKQMFDRMKSELSNLESFIDHSNMDMENLKKMLRCLKDIIDFLKDSI